MEERPLAEIAVGHQVGASLTIAIASIPTPGGLIRGAPISSASFACQINAQREVGVGTDRGWKREGRDEDPTRLVYTEHGVAFSLHVEIRERLDGTEKLDQARGYHHVMCQVTCRGRG